MVFPLIMTVLFKGIESATNLPSTAVEVNGDMFGFTSLDFQVTCLYLEEWAVDFNVMLASCHVLLQHARQWRRELWSTIHWVLSSVGRVVMMNWPGSSSR